MKLLSIVIPAFNRQFGFNKLLADLYNAIEESNLQSEVEIIVVDDCSSAYITIPGLILNVTLIRNDKNLGAPASRKIGFESSRGQFIHFHDSDDTISEGWLGKVIQQLKQDSNLDILMTARVDHEMAEDTIKVQKYFNLKSSHPNKIKSRLIYRNCMGPLGGVTFSRRVLDKTEFKSFASCQDWQMYIDVIKHAKVLVSRPDIKFIFNKTGDDRISHNPRKKILGHLQLAKITGKKSIFGRHIRLFYLYTCKQHIYNKGGYVLRFYKKNRLIIFATFLIVSIYWRVT
ncbi:glycosyltransferase family 2 protein [Cocleimonas sp. KMM 6892]|uniref:glycosyltransferase family 2 protein n=1 Tax=unclassified Cocleimonas TaxID=2639732 RepID=UPI002DB5EAB3|nr:MULTISPECIES: glycosyltransferase family 2 protein [unclassified Cocleimonas]MEB8430921.1 glycosyltransferase family 2 protein [Cocleimonas sp. KMM 6892]MEC4714307.1 glycosyltransferase family 2 protein [Cocleimonas sp. KMM 6895]MEC4743638.1 glycosyltransferase family 2 protein [Cocleimonas sp. KMM 6896]